MEEKERLEKLEPAEALADRGEKTETIEAGNGRKDRREASLNMDGELSVEAVRRWLLWAGLALGICLAASCILGTVFLMQNRKPAVLLTVDGKDSRELVLNRKGGVIRKNGNPDSMAGLSLRECCERLLEELHGAQMLGDQEAALFTVRPIEGAVPGGYRTDGGGDRRCRRIISDDPPGQGDRICWKYLRGAGGPGAGQGKRLLCG